MGNLDSKAVKNYLDSKNMDVDNRNVTYSEFAFGSIDVGNLSCYTYCHPKLLRFDVYTGVYLLVMFNRHKQNMFLNLVVAKEKEMYADLFYSWFREYLINNYIEITDGKYTYVKGENFVNQQLNNDISNIMPNDMQLGNVMVTDNEKLLAESITITKKKHKAKSVCSCCSFNNAMSRYFELNINDIDSGVLIGYQAVIFKKREDISVWARFKWGNGYEDTTYQKILPIEVGICCSNNVYQKHEGIYRVVANDVVSHMMFKIYYTMNPTNYISNSLGVPHTLDCVIVENSVKHGVELFGNILIPFLSRYDYGSSEWINCIDNNNCYHKDIMVYVLFNMDDFKGFFGIETLNYISTVVRAEVTMQ